MVERFAVGDKVAWSHKLGALFGDSTTMKRATVLSNDPAAVFGIVVSIENGDKERAATIFGVDFDADEEGNDVHVVPAHKSHVLTFEELVKVED